MDTALAGGFWEAALIWGVVAAALLWLLARTVRRPALERVRWAVPVAAALFWGIFATVLVYGMWASYYEYFYSTRLRLIIPLYAPLLYAVVGTFLWWAARRLPGNPAVTFCLLGGLESLAEHLIAIYALDILERVPLLQGSDPLAVLAFAFPEYVVYWGIVLALAAILARFWTYLQSRRGEENVNAAKEK
ncbi:MAG: hypothetical protein RRC07_04220 [Anaerolineae bacterium]|nr:hypothetical protein [Anaerolineae bacterium]